ncbi:MAG: T9SS type A sorting domain-containing protein [Chitinophagales bacterium]
MNDDLWDIMEIDTNGDGIKKDGFIAVGSTQTPDSYNAGVQALVLRLKPNGTVRWADTLGGIYDDVAYAVEQATDNSIVVCGTRKDLRIQAISAPNTNLWLFQLNVLTGARIGGDHEYGGGGNEDGFDIVVDTAGNYIVAGGTGRKNNGDLSGFTINPYGEYWVLCIDKTSFNILWQNIYAGGYLNAAQSFADRDFAFSVLKDTSGPYVNYVVSGYCSSCDPSGHLQEAMLVKISSIGSTIWQYSYGDVNTSLPTRTDQGSHSVALGYDGTNYNYISAGVDHTLGTSGGANCFANQHDVYGFKVSSAGLGSTWTPACHLDYGRNYGGSKTDDGYAALQTCSGDYLLLGKATKPDNDVYCNASTASSPPSDAWLVRINSTGGIVWDQSFGGIYNDAGHSLKRMLNGTYVFAGYKEQATGNADAYIVEFELKDACAAPTGLSRTVNGCNVTITWNASACAPYYSVKYVKSGSPINYITVATNTVTFAPGSGTYAWGVAAICSPNNISSYTVGTPNFTVGGGCRLESPPEKNSGQLVVYPNPSAGSFHVACQFTNAINTKAVLQILDLTGSVQQFTEVTPHEGLIDQNISFANLEAGFYWAKITVDGQTYLAKLIIQKP